MTSHYNQPYERRFADPDRRPSNERRDPVLEHTRWRVEQLGRWLDSQEVVAEAERLVRAGRDWPRGLGAGEPGE